MLKCLTNRLTIAVWLTIAPFVALAIADGAELDELAGQTESADAERIAELVRRLDAEQFAERNAASRQLQQLGPAACPALADVAVRGSREQRNRALDLLDQLYQDGQPVTREAANHALEMIASSDHEASARRAREILEPKQEPPAAPIHNFEPKQEPPAAPIHIVEPRQIQGDWAFVCGGIVGGAVERRKLQPGVQQIETDDGRRKIKVVETENQGIEVEITEERNGAIEFEKFQVKDAKELAERHPEAHAVYQRLDNAGLIVFEFNLGDEPPIPVP